MGKINRGITIRNLKNTGLIILSIIILMLPAILNKYPLLHPDCGTYIYSGFKSFVPKDRPIFYGLFIRHVSLSESLWFVIILQAIITVYLIYTFLKPFKFKNTIAITAGIIILLYFLTGIAHYVSQPTPDIFSGFALLIVLIIITQKVPLWESILLSIILCFSNIIHFSHLGTISGFSIMYFLSALFFPKVIKPTKSSFVILTFVLIFSWGIVPIVNKAYTDEYSVAKYRSVLITARLVEMGIITDFLNENCQENNYIFCDEIDELKSLNTVADFVWTSKSPLLDEDCLKVNSEKCWSDKAPKLQILIREVVKQPKYRALLIKNFIGETFKQFSRINLKHFVPLVEGAPVHFPIKTFLRNDYKYYMSARQALQGVRFNLRNAYTPYIYFSSMIISFGLILFYGRKNKAGQFIFFTAIIVYYILNAAICANFSNVVGRYQNRIAWVITLLAFALILNLLKDTRLYDGASWTKKWGRLFFHLFKNNGQGENKNFTRNKP